jgi:hypothetical protein
MANTNNPALASLAKRLIIAELRSQGATDPETVEALVSSRLRITAEGEVVALNRGGSVMPGEALQGVIADLKRHNPSLFPGSKPADTAPASAKNPFAAGPDHNLTAQMVMWRSDPERAEYLAAEAGLTIKPIR